MTSNIKLPLLESEACGGAVVCRGVRESGRLPQRRCRCLGVVGPAWRIGRMDKVELVPQRRCRCLGWFGPAWKVRANGGTWGSSATAMPLLGWFGPAWRIGRMDRVWAEVTQRRCRCLGGLGPHGGFGQMEEARQVRNGGAVAWVG